LDIAVNDDGGSGIFCSLGALLTIEAIAPMDSRGFIRRPL